MAQDPGTGRARRSGGAPGDPANMPGSNDEVTLAQALPNTPLPPFTPSDPAAPPAAGTLMPPPPAPTGAAPGQQAGQSAISLTWAVQTTFLFMFTSVILLVILAATTANVKGAAVVGWTIAIVVVFNLLYAALVFSLARRAPGQPWNWSLFGSTRRP